MLESLPPLEATWDSIIEGYIALARVFLPRARRLAERTGRGLARLGTRRARSASSSGCSASTWVSSSLETLYQPGQQRLLSSTDARRDTWPGRTRIPRELVTGAGRRGSCSEVAVGATAMRDPED